MWLTGRVQLFQSNMATVYDETMFRKHVENNLKSCFPGLLWTSTVCLLKEHTTRLYYNQKISHILQSCFEYRRKVCTGKFYQNISAHLILWQESWTTSKDHLMRVASDRKLWFGISCRVVTWITVCVAKKSLANVLKWVMLFVTKWPFYNHQWFPSAGVFSRGSVLMMASHHSGLQQSARPHIRVSVGDSSPTETRMCGQTDCCKPLCIT